MTPEVRVLLVQVAAIIFTYNTLYPLSKAITLKAMMRINIPVTALLLAVFGIAFAGEGIGFSLLLFSVPWWLFVLLSGVAIEAPLFIWYCKKHDIDMSPP
jgi:hypothetical protein